ncbi:putative membrane protein (TIGR02234 family) [Nakamurella sp. UYEF19]|uniref:Trp biosynthesis-associated membrane protein n=1 Tax=Nakamurella sp. UYEF19 TaxID=1756392 RepID=UPI0033999C88
MSETSSTTAAVTDPTSTAKARRRPAVLALLVVLGAAAAAGAAAMTWWTQAFADSLSGTITTRATGSQTDALLIPVALVALAGFGAALATTGAVRRLVGAVLALGGAGAAGLAIVAMFSAPSTLRSDLTRPADSAGPAQVHVIGPILGLLAGLLVALAGVLVMAGFGARKGRRALGSRYDAPIARRRSAGNSRETTAATGAVAAAAPDLADPAADANAAAQWWKALDAGHDPTASDGSAGKRVVPTTVTADDWHPDSNDADPGASPGGPTRPPES